jgi:hypothetical protein
MEVVMIRVSTVLVIWGLLPGTVLGGNDRKKFHDKWFNLTSTLGSSSVLVSGNITSWITGE